MTPAGQFRHRIHILERTLTPIGLNQQKSGWNRIAGPLPAKVVSGTGTKTEESQRTESNHSYTITIRNFRGLTTEHMIEMEGVRLGIGGIGRDPNDIQEREMVLWCQSPSA